MSTTNTDLRNFLDVVEKVARSIANDTPLSGGGLAVVENSGALDLARDAADLGDVDAWLSHAVRVAAHHSPSLAFLLCARYAAQRAILDENVGGSDPTFALGEDQAVAPTALGPTALVVVDSRTEAARLVAWSDITTVEERRTGLKDAAMVTASLSPATPAIELTTGPSAVADWNLLTSAALLGIAETAVRTAVEYANARRQFGVAISSFAGLRALLGDMELRVRGLESMLSLTLTGDRDSDEVAAVAGRVAVSVCIDAIQVHGGYGYMEEYPVAGLLRDAVSLQARAGGRRTHLARVARRTIDTEGAWA